MIQNMGDGGRRMRKEQSLSNIETSLGLIYIKTSLSYIKSYLKKNSPSYMETSLGYIRPCPKRKRRSGGERNPG